MNACKIFRSAVCKQHAYTDRDILHFKTLSPRMTAMMPPDVKESFVDEIKYLPVPSDHFLKKAILLLDGGAMLFQRQVHDLMARQN